MKILLRSVAVCAALLCCICAAARTKVYCEIVGMERLLSNKMTVSVDFGQENKLFSDQSLVDENGKKIVFNSMVDALNWMSGKGWEFEEAYIVTIGSNESRTNIRHWLLSKTIDEGESAGDGLLTRDAMNKGKTAPAE